MLEPTIEHFSNLEKISIVGLVFCHDLENIMVDNTKEKKYKMANMSPRGEINFPCMLKLNMMT